MSEVETGSIVTRVEMIDLWVRNPSVEPEVHRITTGIPVRLGRSSQNDVTVQGDRSISRRHVTLLWDGSCLQIDCTDSAKNPVVVGQQSVRTARLSLGGIFSIGGSVFQIVEHGDDPDDAFRNATVAHSGSTIVPPPLSGLGTEGLDTIDNFGGKGDGRDEPSVERMFAADELRQLRFGAVDRQLELLSALPGRIESSRSDEDLAVQVAELLLEALPRAEAAAVVSVDLESLSTPDQIGRWQLVPQMMRVDSRRSSEGTFRPSRQLIARTLLARKSVLHIWGDGGSDEDEGFTQTMGLDWAFAVPLLSDASRGWCLYVSGRGGPRGAFNVRPDDFQGELRFTELVAQFLGSVRQVRVLQDQKTQLSSFFSPKVIDSLMDSGGVPSLEPDARDVTVLFCDVRGFSLKSEVEDDELPNVLRSGREALGVMASAILDYDGAIADFQGDAALGFWGWPVPLDDGPLPACRAALTIASEFRRASKIAGGPMQGFGVGIGIAHGRALAGQIGTDNQAKIGVFGRIVNLGSRLEGMTKFFGVDVCVDEATARWIQQSATRLNVRLRPLARVTPKGMTSAETVYGLVPPLREAPHLTDAMIEAHSHAVTAIIEGRWADAAELLRQFPVADIPARFLLRFLQDGQRKCPPDWDGAIPLRRK
ncbi:FHA domain-containing protein [bacterium]|nr:FHA domain-containing protein [bacterium]